MTGGRAVLLLPLLVISALFAQISASDPLFHESFDESFDGSWIVSGKDEYKGAWKHSKSDGHEDYGLLVSEPARKYAIIKELDYPVTLKDKTVVLQFEVRLQNGLECGGAYIKYIRPQAVGWNAKDFDNDTPYTIMFGPDKCGSTNKVHFILKHKNPKTGKYVEHHLKSPPSVPYDKLSHVYTAILKPDNEVRILVDGVEKSKANFLSADDFEPALIPSKTIPDPDDKKPEDWDERAKIPDPDAVKPDDWDEDAPMEIVDEEATKPEGWLDDEPEEIDDPEAAKPEDWDDEEDGEWEAPKMDNPKCEEAPGCGEWKKPMKDNPAYKGKWHAPLIDNPNYKGIWKPQEIPNPEYFELDKPDFDPIAAIGIEIWTMQDGILFDNILIADNEKVATSVLEKTWKPKFDVEKEKQKAEEAAAGASEGLSEFQKKIFDILYKVADIPFLEPYKTKIIEVIEKGETQPNITISILASVVVVIVTVLFRTLFGGKKPVAPVKPAAETKKPSAVVPDATAGSSGDKEEKEDDKDAPRRRSRRDA
ncbi:Calnexin-like protein 1 [Hordeum vulgare]|uniref:Predicted protein n=1 Tax=Hordeum vulgare subsp. vulgare TaxID=112509 RepID=F2DGG1_HORVV|nr:calnexin homolog [Hordeum vulgare subsp. vulgare]KAE8775686.1 Calnexin-like protein 1 [Hordeum vulgare]BAJ94182.1 predicted protein [Hordeum vulgare subsp. vulgare]